MQAFAFNLRRPNFQDERMRRAFNRAFDFEGIRPTGNNAARARTARRYGRRP